MCESELRTDSFVVKIWREEVAENSGHPVWRGHVTHVPDGERQYFKDLDGLVSFIQHYLEMMRAANNQC